MWRVSQVDSDSRWSCWLKAMRSAACGPSTAITRTTSPAASVNDRASHAGMRMRSGSGTRSAAAGVPRHVLAVRGVPDDLAVLHDDLAADDRGGRPALQGPALVQVPVGGGPHVVGRHLALPFQVDEREVGVGADPDRALA